MKMVSVGCDGSLHGVTQDNVEMTYIEGAEIHWQNASGKLLSVAVFQQDLIYGIDTIHTTYGHLHLWTTGPLWSQLSDIDIDCISVAKDGSLFAVLHSDGSLVKWSGTAWGSSLGAATGLKAIAAKSATMVWAVGSDDKLYYWNGLTWVQSSTETVSGLALAMM